MGHDPVLALYELTNDPDPRIRLEAIKIFLDRAWGKAVETSVQITLDEREGQVLSALSPDQLAGLLGIEAPELPPGKAVDGLQTIEGETLRVEGNGPPKATD